MQYKGEIKGFPQHVVEAMLDEQERQGKKRDVTVFEKNKDAGLYHRGFNWGDSVLGYDIWGGIIGYSQFHLIEKPKPQEPKKDRFPFKLKEEDAKRIINIACNDWKPRLAKKWGKDLLMQGYVEVSKHYYNEMRKACTSKQNEMFDEIFGKDEEFIPEGTPCLVTDNIDTGWKLRYADGMGGFYEFGLKKGISMKWYKYQVLDINNLPVNE